MVNSSKPIKPRRPRRITISDVARAAGVSRHAVERAFKPNAPLSDENRSRILEAAQNLGFHPGPFVAERSAPANIVALVTGARSSQSDRDWLDAMRAELVAVGKWPLVLNSDDFAGSKPIDDKLGFAVDAMIVQDGLALDRAIAACRESQIPLIISGSAVGGDTQELKIDFAACDFRDGMYRMTKLLVETGRRRLGLLSAPDNGPLRQELLAGAQAALADAGLEFIAQAESGRSFADSIAAAKAVIENHRLDALVCTSDETAIAALAAARDGLGLRVPNDIAITGLGDIETAAWPLFSLTTLSVPVAETAAATVKLLQQRLQTPSKSRQAIWLNAALIERDTH